MALNIHIEREEIIKDASNHTEMTISKLFLEKRIKPINLGLTICLVIGVLETERKKDTIPALHEFTIFLVKQRIR